MTVPGASVGMVLLQSRGGGDLGQSFICHRCGPWGTLVIGSVTQGGVNNDVVCIWYEVWWLHNQPRASKPAVVA